MNGHAARAFQLLAQKPSFWFISLGAAASSMMGYGLFFWLPSFFVRSFGLSLLDASVFYGAILLIGGAGTVSGSLIGTFFDASSFIYFSMRARSSSVNGSSTSMS